MANEMSTSTLPSTNPSRLDSVMVAANELVSNFSGNFNERFEVQSESLSNGGLNLPSELIAKARSILKSFGLPDLPDTGFDEALKLCEKHPELSAFLRVVKDEPLTPALLLTRIPDLLNLFTTISAQMEAQEEDEFED